MDLQEVEWRGIDWTDLDQDREKCWEFVNAVISLRAPENARNFLPSLGLVSFSGRTLFNGNVWSYGPYLLWTVGVWFFVYEKMRRKKFHIICSSLSVNIYHCRFKKRKGKWKYCSILKACRVLIFPRIWLFTHQYRLLAALIPLGPWDNTVIIVTLHLCGIHSFLLYWNTPIVPKLESDGRNFVTKGLYDSLLFQTTAEIDKVKYLMWFWPCIVVNMWK